ncbi:deaminase [Anthocerotibacter panamensis]|uniref:deaminase n=1 Tax=Anthocerotibacter panamensis TaxID=2857077 RepID=UPI001C4021E4|nr:deaminase [Anthocerotibacter panamensis]
MHRSPDHTWLLEAIECSRQCPPSAGAFSVGAIIVDAAQQKIASGYSRETGDGAHAEEIALQKAHQAQLDLRGATIYSSLEPCSVRLSQKRSCTDRMLAAGIARVVFALYEPSIFVVCRGAETLMRHGVEVVVLPEYGPLVVAINQHLMAAP